MFRRVVRATKTQQHLTRAQPVRLRLCQFPRVANGRQGEVVWIHKNLGRIEGRFLSVLAIENLGRNLAST
jgi:hypothetical protein